MRESTKEISSHIVEAVARAKETDSKTLPPLYDAVDPDALDALFTHATTTVTRHESAPTVQFSYAGLTVVVRSATNIEVRGPTDESESEKLGPS